MPMALHLEPFDDEHAGIAHPSSAAQPDASFEDGYAAGLAAAEENFAADQSVLRAALIDALRDIDTSYDRARADLISALGPLHEALISVLLPELLAPTLVLRLQELLAEASRKTCSAPLTVLVPTGQAEILQHAIADSGLTDVTFAEETSLSPYTVRVVLTQGEVALDLDAALAAIAEQMEVFSSLTEDSGKVTTHG